MPRPTTQIYSDYTPEDFSVWKTLYERQMNQLHSLACREYIDALQTVQFSADRIPEFRLVNDTIGPLTGWSLHVVPNISPQKDFFEYLSRKEFTATCWLRTMEQLDYIEEPDMFHDVFAHVPLLSNQAYCDFFQALSDLAIEHIDDPKAIEMLGRVYWFTIEFGLMSENDGLKIYGAGIISSYGETKHCLENKSKKHDFDVKKILHTNFRTDILQENYFVIDSFDQLFHSLGDIRDCLEEALD